MVSELGDTGARSNGKIFGQKTFQDAGFDKNELLPVSITIQNANKIPVNILGAFRATVNRMSLKNEVISYNIIIYVSGWVFFSCETMVELLTLNRDFLTIVSQLPHQHS